MEGWAVIVHAAITPSPQVHDKSLTRAITEMDKIARQLRLGVIWAGRVCLSRKAVSGEW